MTARGPRAGPWALPRQLHRTRTNRRSRSVRRPSFGTCSVSPVVWSWLRVRSSPASIKSATDCREVCEPDRFARRRSV